MKKTVIIAEAGVNHNGSYTLAKKLVDNAKSAGFDAVKFQKRNINKVYSKEILDSPRESPWGSTTREQKEGLELNFEEYLEMVDCAKTNYTLKKQLDKALVIWYTIRNET